MKRVLIIIMLISLFINLNAQEDNNSSLTYTMGAGIAEGDRTIGGGFHLSFGYLTEIVGNRFRVNPSLSLGFYNARFITDVRDQSFNSINLEALFSYDLIRLGNVSLILSGGGGVNIHHGLLGTGGYPPGSSGSEYVSDAKIVGAFGGGFRFVSRERRISIEIKPLNFRIGTNYFFEGYTSIGIAYRL